MGRRRWLRGSLARERAAEWRNLDSTATRDAAQTDPEGFVDHPELLVIDEIQRVPELLLAIKEQVDADPRPGRYLLTGSARARTASSARRPAWPNRDHRALAVLPGRDRRLGRRARRPALLRRGDRRLTPEHESDVSRAEYAERIVRGGFPEAVARTGAARRERFFDSYVGDLVARDVTQLTEIERLLDADAHGLLRPGSAFGPLLEGFVVSEIARQLTWSRRRVELSHYRTKDGVEVDVVMEDRRDASSGSR